MQNSVTGGWDMLTWPSTWNSFLHNIKTHIKTISSSGLRDAGPNVVFDCNCHLVITITVKFTVTIIMNCRWFVASYFQVQRTSLEWIQPVAYGEHEFTVGPYQCSIIHAGLKKNYWRTIGQTSWPNSGPEAEKWDRKKWKCLCSDRTSQDLDNDAKKNAEDHNRNKRHQYFVWFRILRQQPRQNTHLLVGERRVANTEQNQHQRDHALTDSCS